jgi:uracil-DNA glycosylase
MKTNKDVPSLAQQGRYLGQLLVSIGLRREQVYITNVVKSRPPGNRDPLPSEVAACYPWLERQIELIRPKIIVTLGRYSMTMFFPGKSISKIHGTAQKWDGRKPSMDLRGSVKVRGEFLLMCLVHNVKRSVKKVLEGTVSLPGKYSRLIEEAMLEYKEEQLTLVKAEV